MNSRFHQYSLLTLLVIMTAGCSSGESTPAAEFSLSVSIAGPGSGTVVSTPAGIHCGTDCSENYPENSIITLTASRTAGSSFAGWSGACNGTAGCDVSMDSAKSVTATFIEYSVDCSAYAAYVPARTPEITLSSSGAAATTLVLMHGKAGSPLDAYLAPLATALSDAGYDVVVPYLPWSETAWDGAMCEAMNYIDSLAAAEALKGRNVVIAGHSMGGAHALIYAATAPSDEVKAVITLAPGHFPHLELPLLILLDPINASSIASSTTLAEEMVAAGNGDQLNTFDTLIPDLNNPLLQISATANHYLSYHALDQFPDINDVLPVIKLPVLWLAGTDDELTDLYNMAVLSGQIASNGSLYQPVSGDHLDMVSNSALAVTAWMLSLGL